MSGDLTGLCLYMPRVNVNVKRGLVTRGLEIMNLIANEKADIIFYRLHVLIKAIGNRGLRM